MNGVSALIFDLDQTLFDRQQAFDDWMESLDITPSERSRLRGLDANGEGDRRIFLDAATSITRHRIDQHEFVESLLHFAQPDVTLIGLLKPLRVSFDLAILTNGGAASQQSKIHSLGLLEVFSKNRIYISAEIGFEKPDPHAFHHVAESLGVANEACCYFGDRIETDVMAARRARWRAIHIGSPDQLKQHLRHWNEVVIC